MQRKTYEKLGYDFSFILKLKCDLLDNVYKLEKDKHKLKIERKKIKIEKSRLESCKKGFKDSRNLFKQMQQIKSWENGVYSVVYLGYLKSSFIPLLSFDKTYWWNNGKIILNIKDKIDFKQIENITIYEKPIEINESLIRNQTASIQQLNKEIRNCDNKIQNYNNFIQKYDDEKKRLEDELNDVNILFLQPDIIPTYQNFERNHYDFFQTSLSLFSHQSSTKRKLSNLDIEEQQEPHQNKKIKWESPRLRE